MLMQWLEGLSYVVTVLGFPIAIYVIVREERLRRINEEHELHRNLTQEYDGFLRLVMDNADLLLMSRGAPKSTLTDEQRERQGQPPKPIIIMMRGSSLAERRPAIGAVRNMARPVTNMVSPIISAL